MNFSLRQIANFAPQVLTDEVLVKVNEALVAL